MMRRRLAIAAILLGLAAIVPVLIAFGHLVAIALRICLPAIDDGTSGAHWSVMILAALLFLLGAPCLLLWGLIEIQSTEQGRATVIMGTVVLFFCTAPFLIGFILGPPLLLCALLPGLREARAT